MDKQKLILVVCRGNIARSPFAEAIIHKELINRNLDGEYSVASRGIQGTSVDPEPVKFPKFPQYGQLYENSRPTLEKFGVDLVDHVSTTIDADIAESSDLIIAMDNEVIRGLNALFPNQANKMHLLTEIANQDHDIVDPAGVSGAEKQEQIFDEIGNIILSNFPYC
ncbi:MAG TPA: hypothetical protein VGS08_00245 [Candidatus Saccharimonadales bacterium]|nr:hypothetical protein [Candidatus Saccharimonadales bacterium]